MSLKYITKKEAKKYKEVFSKVIQKIKRESNYSFNFYLVGSGRRNLILANEDKKFDLDYQIRLSSNVINAKDVKKDFLELFKKEFSKEKGWYCADSTSAITIKKTADEGNVEFSYDVVLCKINDKTMKFNIIQKNDNNYRWNEISEYKNFRENLRFIKGNDWKIIREIYRKKKIENLNASHPRKSFILFIETVNDVKNKKVVNN